MRWIGVGCAASIVGLGHLLFRRLISAGPLLLGATALLALSPALAAVTSSASSEAPFIVVSLLLLLVADRVRRGDGADVPAMAFLTVLCWGAFALRYAGVALIGVGVVAIGTSPALASRPRRWSRAFLFLLLAFSFPAVWMLRNREQDGTWLGPRVPSPDSAWDVAERVFRTVGVWAIGGPAPAAVAVAVGVGLVAVVAWFGTRRSVALAARRLPVRSATFPCLVFVLVYTAYLAVAQLSTGIDPIDLRLLAPVYVPTVGLVAVGIRRATERRPDGNSTGRGTGSVTRHLAVLGIVVLLGQAMFTLRAVAGAHRDGLGFNARATVQSDLARVTDEAATTEDATVYTNSVEDLWSATGRQPLRRSPAFAGIRGTALDGELEAFVQEVACAERPVLLAWYRDGDPKSFGLQRLQEGVTLESSAEASDGTLFRVVALPSGRSEPCRDH